MANLMVIPEHKLIKMLQDWMNLDVNTQQLIYAYGYYPSATYKEDRDKIIESFKPIEEEIKRRAKLVLK